MSAWTQGKAVRLILTKGTRIVGRLSSLTSKSADKDSSQGLPFGRKELSDHGVAWGWSLKSRKCWAVFLYWLCIIVTWGFKNTDGDSCEEILMCSSTPGLGEIPLGRATWLHTVHHTDHSSAHWTHPGWRAWKPRSSNGGKEFEL